MTPNAELNDGELTGFLLSQTARGLYGQTLGIPFILTELHIVRLIPLALIKSRMYSARVNLKLNR